MIYLINTAGWTSSHALPFFYNDALDIRMFWDIAIVVLFSSVGFHMPGCKYNGILSLQVVLVRWNEPYQKLATCDDHGIIFVWIKHEGRWSIELINDRNSQVRFRTLCKCCVCIRSLLIDRSSERGSFHYSYHSLLLLLGMKE